MLTTKRTYTQDEIEDLVDRSRNGDRSAKNELAMSVIYMVYKLIGRFRRAYKFLDRDELSSAGHLGLAVALNRYDPSRGKLTTYAHKCVLSKLKEVLHHYMNNYNQTVNLDDDCIAPVERFGIEFREMCGLLRQHLDALRPRDADIFSRVFINGESLKSVGAFYSISKQRVQQIAKRAFRELKGIIHVEHVRTSHRQRPSTRTSPVGRCYFVS